MISWRMYGWPTAEEWAAWWAFSTFLVAVVASGVAYCEFRRARSRDREDNQAALLVNLEFTRGGVYLVVVNTGRAVARDCRLRVATEQGGKVLLDQKLSRLAPGSPVKINLGTRFGSSSTDVEETLELTTQHDGFEMERSTVPLSDFEGTLVERDPLLQIAAAVDRIARRR